MWFLPSRCIDYFLKQKKENQLLMRKEKLKLKSNLSHTIVGERGKSQEGLLPFEKREKLLEGPNVQYAYNYVQRCKIKSEK